MTLIISSRQNAEFEFGWVISLSVRYSSISKMYEEAAMLAQEMRLDFQEQQKDRKMTKKNDQYFISDEFSKYLDNVKYLYF